MELRSRADYLFHIGLLVILGVAVVSPARASHFMLTFLLVLGGGVTLLGWFCRRRSFRQASEACARRLRDVEPQERRSHERIERPAA